MLINLIFPYIILLYNIFYLKFEKRVSFRIILSFLHLYLCWYIIIWRRGTILSNNNLLVVHQSLLQLWSLWYYKMNNYCNSSFLLKRRTQTHLAKISPFCAFLLFFVLALLLSLCPFFPFLYSYYVVLVVFVISTHTSTTTLHFFEKQKKSKQKFRRNIYETSLYFKSRRSRQ